MDLHELFNTAVADLPDLPDQVPAAQRIHRRRTAMTRSFAIGATAALVVGVGTLTIASPWSHQPTGSAVSVASAANGPATVGSFTQYSPTERSAAPDLSGVTLTGAAYSTSYAGHVTVLETWGSWCTPCIKSLPAMVQAYRKYQSEGVRFLGIDVMDDNATALRDQTDYRLGYPSLRDPDRTLAQRLGGFVPTTSVASIVIVDPNGEVAATSTSFATATQLDQQIAYALATTTSP